MILLFFASCKKSNIQFTTFDGKPAQVWTVQIEAQQDGAPSIWSPISSITLPQ